MKTCPKCGTEHSNKLSQCPHCNTPLVKKGSNKVAVIISVSVVYLLVMVVAIVFLTNAICLSHNWMDATCAAAKTCKNCGETEGEPLAHVWMDATCAAAKTCKNCGETEGEPLAHTPGEWTTAVVPSLIIQGKDTLSCTVCGTVIEEQILEKKVPKINGSSFNFNNTEFIDWLQTISPIELDMDTFAESDDGYTYPITYKNGETGIVMLNCSSNGKLGNVHAIIIYFENKATAISVLSDIGTVIDPNFSRNDASIKLYTGKNYVVGKMTAIMYESDDMLAAVLSPTVFLRNSNILN